MIELTKINELLSGDIWPTKVQIRESITALNAMEPKTEKDKMDVGALLHWAFYLDEATGE